MTDWGNAFGDDYADQIMETRKAEHFREGVFASVISLAAIAAGVWFGATKSGWALSLMVLLAGAATAGRVSALAVGLETRLRINEVRLRLIERAVQAGVRP